MLSTRDWLQVEVLRVSAANLTFAFVVQLPTAHDPSNAVFLYEAQMNALVFESTEKRSVVQISSHDLGTLHKSAVCQIVSIAVLLGRRRVRAAPNKDMPDTRIARLLIAWIRTNPGDSDPLAR